MFNVFMAWAPDTPEVRRAAEEVKGALSDSDFAFGTQPAASASITDIAGADLVLFGVGKVEGELPPDYAELARVFTGANLAGKAAACFSVGAPRASAGLRRHLRSTGISLFEEEPLPGEKGARTGQPSAEPQQLREWSRRVKEFLLGVRDGRR